MGVKDLWNILSPVSQKLSLYDMQGKSVAVDLSCWVCEGQCVGEKAITQPRMYLRTLFFRTQTLLMMNVTPIFVLDGDAPQLKHAVMKERNNARFKYRQKENEDAPKRTNNGGRSRFKGILKQCRHMLEIMGVTCLESNGEAEALCGLLNRDGVVDGVITQDSDVFLYGAHTVYRNLTIKSGTGTVDAYYLPDIKSKLNLDRKKLIAMSILCGCDYNPSGLHGIGKELAYNFVSTIEGDPLMRLRCLRYDKTLKRYEEEKAGCTKCCHAGKMNQHRKDGCTFCDVKKGCNENTSYSAFKNKTDEEKKSINLELALYRKAVADDTFPCEDTIDEFLNFKQHVSELDFTWKLPNITKFAGFCNQMLEWELNYGFEKILPMLTRWLLLQTTTHRILTPSEIVKKRVIKGVPSLDILWAIDDKNIEQFSSLLSEDCAVLKNDYLLTTEPISLVSARFPTIYSAFVERTTKKPKKKSKRNKENINLPAEDVALPNGSPKKAQPEDGVSYTVTESVDDCLGSIIGPLKVLNISTSLERCANSKPIKTKKIKKRNIEDINSPTGFDVATANFPLKETQPENGACFSVAEEDYLSSILGPFNTFNLSSSLQKAVISTPIKTTSMQETFNFSPDTYRYESDLFSPVQTNYSRSPSPRRYDASMTIVSNVSVDENKAALLTTSDSFLDQVSTSCVDESTVDYDISQIVNDIVGRKYV